MKGYLSSHDDSFLKIRFLFQETVNPVLDRKADLKSKLKRHLDVKNVPRLSFRFLLLVCLFGGSMLCRVSCYVTCFILFFGSLFISSTVFYP